MVSVPAGFSSPLWRRPGGQIGLCQTGQFQRDQREKQPACNRPVALPAMAWWRRCSAPAVQGEASRTLVRGQSDLSSAAKRATRIVAGLPVGYFEAFATLYRDYADILAARRQIRWRCGHRWSRRAHAASRPLRPRSARMPRAAAGSTSSRRFEPRLTPRKPPLSAACLKKFIMRLV
jgi:hypothetical protein